MNADRQLIARGTTPRVEYSCARAMLIRVADHVKYCQITRIVVMSIGLTVDTHLFLYPSSPISRGIFPPFTDPDTCVWRAIRGQVSMGAVQARSYTECHVACVRDKSEREASTQHVGVEDTNSRGARRSPRVPH